METDMSDEKTRMHGTRTEHEAKGVCKYVERNISSCDKEHQGGVKHTYQRVIRASVHETKYKWETQ